MEFEPRGIMECERVLSSLNIAFTRNTAIPPTPRKRWDVVFFHNGRNYVLDYHMQDFKTPYSRELPISTDTTHEALRHGWYVILILRSDNIQNDIETALAGTDTLYTSYPEFTQQTLKHL